MIWAMMFYDLRLLKIELKFEKNRNNNPLKREICGGDLKMMRCG